MGSDRHFTEVGYPRAKHYTNPDMRIDFAVYDDEDIGFTNIAEATAAYEFALPYPADVDIDNEVMILHWIDFIYGVEQIASGSADVDLFGLDILVSMLDFDFDNTNPIHTFDDTNALELKKAFDGPYRWNLNERLAVHLQGTAASEQIVTLDAGLASSLGTQMLRWIPVHPLDLPLPLFIAFNNNSYSYTADDLGAAFADEDFTLSEAVAMRIHYTKRKMTAKERDIRGQTKFMRLGA